MRKIVQLCPNTSKNKIICFSESQIPAEPDREPIENLSKRHKADPKTKSTEAAKAGDEVQPSHLWGSLELWMQRDLICYYLELQLTVYSRLSEEDVHDGNVSLIGIVVGFTLKLSFVSSLVVIGFNLCEGCYELPVIHGVWILFPHWS